ncbi:TonB-dependent receptor plug domain-containing protein [Roseivirga sp.]|uniref:TonB-dependent receptor plug domain-containing protein n=1 Tax=Roseivirga sp. TaxID=1964215 RepID=UPI002B27C08B|nr:TonB-dependent receptor plug domain-containing protein [Roseivirga sp.]
MFLFLSLGACASTAGSSSKKGKDYSIYQTLGDALQSVGSLKVTGQGGSFTVNLIAGKYANSNLGADQGSVLYVINGIDQGKDYGAASSLVTPKDIISIRVLNGSEAVMKWGDRGTGGVVEIKTSTGNE